MSLELLETQSIDMPGLKRYYIDSIRAIEKTDTDRHNITDIQDYVRALELYRDLQEKKRLSDVGRNVSAL